MYKIPYKIDIGGFYDTSVDNLGRAGHEPGPQGICFGCNSLKRVEDKWMLRMGAFHGAS